MIFGIEGFWGAVNHDRLATRRFLIFLVVFFAVSLIIAIVDVETVEQYCSTAESADDESYCRSTATLYGYLMLGAALILVPIYFALSVFFYIHLIAENEVRLRKKRMNNNEVDLKEIKATSFGGTGGATGHLSSGDPQTGSGGQDNSRMERNNSIHY